MRHNVQNWKEWRGKNDTIILGWDSGLAWLHGPIGEPTCDNLLCGPKEWRVAEPGWDDTNCRYICRFNKQTILELQKMNEGLYKMIMKSYQLQRINLLKRDVTWL